MKLKRLESQDHHDGHGLADRMFVCADEKDPKAGNASHEYAIEMDVDNNGYVVSLAHIQFQHGARHIKGSTPGILDGALITILLDRFRGFQAGPFKSRENAITIGYLEESLMWIQRRAHDRARRGVLRKNEQ